MTLLDIPVRNRPVYLQTDAGRVVMMVRGEPFTTYSYGPGSNPGVAALFAADSRQVAGRPAGMAAVTVGHEEVNGVSYLRDSAHGGSIEHRELTVRRGLYSVGFVHRLVWRDGHGSPVMADARRVRVTAGPCDGGILDIALRLTPLIRGGVHFGATAHDLLRIHLASSLAAPQMGQMRNEHGHCGTEEVDGRISRWVSVDGVIRGETVGLVVLDHPRNPFHPTTWRADCEGTLSPSPVLWAGVDETLSKTIVIRYRIITHCGYVEAGWSQARFQEYANEPCNNEFGDRE